MSARIAHRTVDHDRPHRPVLCTLTAAMSFSVPAHSRYVRTMTELDALPCGPAKGFAGLGRRGALFDLAVACGVTGIGMTNLYLLFGPLAGTYRRLGPSPYHPALSAL